MYEDHIPQAIPTDIKGLLLQALGSRELKMIHKNFYSSETPHDFFQGNCLENLVFVNLPDSTIREHLSLVISNPCDTDLKNDHTLSPRLTYCAVKKLISFEEVLRKYADMTSEEITAYMGNVKAQRISDLFYLPAGTSNEEDRVAILSQSVSSDLVHADEAPHDVTSRLSQKAYYLLLTKLSIHFLRFGELPEGNTA